MGGAGEPFGSQPGPAASNIGRPEKNDSASRISLSMAKASSGGLKAGSTLTRSSHLPRCAVCVLTIPGTSASFCGAAPKRVRR